MGEKIESLKIAILQAFPNLIADPDFKITSPAEEKYNCIAWAYGLYQDRWMWPGGDEHKVLDGFYYWPEGVEDTEEVLAFINAFILKGFELSNSWEHEDEYERIALYVVPGTTQCTHAARELRSGKWTSKLGKGNDIQHGTPFMLEGSNYGKVFCIMKRLFS